MHKNTVLGALFCLHYKAYSDYKVKQSGDVMKIGELAKLTGTETVTIRFYEQKGLMLLPGRTAGNYRNYSDAHRERLLFIRHCRGIGINLDEINQPCLSG